MYPDAANACKCNSVKNLDRNCIFPTKKCHFRWNCCTKGLHTCQGKVLNENSLSYQAFLDQKYRVIVSIYSNQLEYKLTSVTAVVFGEKERKEKKEQKDCLCDKSLLLFGVAQKG